MKYANFFVAVAIAAGLGSVTAHPHGDMSHAELAIRQLAAGKRHLKARACSSQISSYHARRKAKRALAPIRARQQASATSSATAPHFTEIQNSTCVTAPEVIEGPYYVNNEYIRTNLTENESGVPLTLDIGVMDTSTCQPLAGAMVELWNANATGFYSAFEAASAASAGGAGNASTSGSVLPPSISATASGTASFPSGSAVPSGAPGEGAGASATATSNNTALRGGFPTNEAGIAEFYTLYPGFYAGRAPHIHVMVHLNWTSSINETLLSHSGSLAHIGQFFMDESMNDAVFNTSAYLANTNTRTLNDEDMWLPTANADGYNAMLQLEQVSDNLQDGLIGYITVGVDPSANQIISSNNYLGTD